MEELGQSWAAMDTLYESGLNLADDLQLDSS